MVCAPAFPMRFESNIPDAGQEGQFTITNETERAIGKCLMYRINGSNAVSDDAIVQEYLRVLCDRISRAAPRCDFKLYYFPIQSNVLNAFAFFGGHVGVYTGLVLMVENESELAAVLAHETAHVTQRHLARMLVQQKKLTPLTIAEICAAIAIGALGAPDAGIGLATAALGGQAQQMINFTREHEYEADRFGIEILSRAGFDPEALPNVFHKLNNKTRYMEKPPEYLLTHPVFEARIADAYNRAILLPKVKPKNDLFFHLVRTRIETDFCTNASDYIEYSQDRLKNGRYLNKTAVEYGYALALAYKRKFSEAKNIINRLIIENEDEPEVWVLELTLADVEQTEGNLAGALDRVKSLYENNHENRAIMIEYAKLLIENRQAEQARHILYKLKRLDPENPFVYQWLAKANGKSGHFCEVHQAQAQWHFLRGEYKASEKQLELAVEKAGNQTQLLEEIKYNKQHLQEWMAREKSLKLPKGQGFDSMNNLDNIINSDLMGHRCQCQ